jgi:copper chaperone CopZ
MRAPAWIIPVLVVVCTAAGIGGSRLLVAPSLVHTFADAAPTADARTAQMVVEGVKCVDTAERAVAQLNELDGVLKCVAYAARARLDVTYDPARTSAPAIREALEAPVLVPATGEYLFGLYQVVELDGEKIADVDD